MKPCRHEDDSGASPPLLFCAANPSGTDYLDPGAGRLIQYKISHRRSSSVNGTKGPLFDSAAVRKPASWLARAKAGDPHMNKRPKRQYFGQSGLFTV